MVDVLLSQDPILRARTFLKRYFPRVEIQVPHGWAWKTTLIVLRDGGGAGEYDRVLSDARLTVEVSDPSVKVASDTARRVLALLHEWPRLESDVYFRSEAGRPAYFPDDETGTPLYTFTVNLAFKHVPAVVPAI